MKNLVVAGICGALLAGGVTAVDVLRRPLVGIIPTGDEIVPPTDAPKKGEIIEFNSTVFRGMLEERGADAKVYPITPDKKDVIRAALQTALAGAEVGIYRDEAMFQALVEKFEPLKVRVLKPVIVREH